MACIDSSSVSLKSWKGDFCVEALEKELDPRWVIDALEQAGCQSLRQRLLPASFMMWFVVLLGLFRRVSYGNLLEKLSSSRWALARWLADGPPTTTAVTRARDRLGVKPLALLWARSARAWVRQAAGLVFHGRRVYALDGSTLKTPDSAANRRRFGKPANQRGRAAYPQMRVDLLVDLGARLVVEECHGPYRKSELALARQLIGRIDRGSLVLLDRYYLVYDLLWDLYRGGRDFLVRLPVTVKPVVVRRIAKGDAIVMLSLPRRYGRERPDMPHTWRLRMITYRPKGAKEDIRLLTTLTGEEITREELSGLYQGRWGEEPVIDEMKTHLWGCHTVNQPVVFRSQTPERVRQEWYGLLLAYNAVRKTIASAAEEQDVPAVRVSFTAAVERIRESVHEMMWASRRGMQARRTKMLCRIARAIVPQRPGRRNPRIVKVQMSKYTVKRKRRAA
jgi:Insertion element 4 transposase N-terminal/Transposase DDE domain